MEVTLFIFIVAIYAFGCNCQFLGGTIFWIQESSGNAIRFTYRLTWQKGFGPCGSSCSTAKIGTGTISSVALGQPSSLEWKYTDGNITGSLNDVNYYVTSVSVHSSLGWEQGENSFVFRGFQPNLTYTIYLDSIPWISSGLCGNRSVGYMDASINLRQRSDTGKINNSPYVSVQPFIGAAFGCTTKVHLPAEDPDGDIVRCRWAETSECGGACTNTPLNAVRLSKASCLLTINAYNETGFLDDTVYRLAVVVEDFPHGAIDVGGVVFTRNRALSRIPLQLTVKVSPSNSSCINHNFTFVRSTPPSYFRYFTTPANLQRPILYRLFYLQTDNSNSTEFMTSIPRLVKYTSRPDFNKRNNVIQLTTTWKPNSNQYGDQQICIWGLRADGITTDTRCITEIISDTFNCQQGTCRNNGTCVNLYNATNDICNCPRGYKPPYCLNETICTDEPCANNGTCLLNGSKYKYSCSCTAGYQGNDCEQEIDHCVQSPCNNNGTCLDLQDRYLCLCSNNYTGSNCQTDLNENIKGSSSQDGSRSIKPWIPATAAVGGVTVLAVLLALIYKCKPSNTTRSHPNSTPIKDLKSSVIKVKPAKAIQARPQSLDF